MKKTLLIALALVALAFASCTKDEVIEPEQTIDNKLIGMWLFDEIDLYNADTLKVLVNWEFTQTNEVITPDTILTYKANGSRLKIGNEVLQYTCTDNQIQAVDVNGNIWRFRR